MARVIRSEAELSRLLARPGYRVASQFGGAPMGEVVNTDAEPPADPRVAPQMTLLELRTLRFRLPQPISVNELYRTNLHTGAKYLTDAQRQFRSQVIGIVRGEMLRAELRNQPLLGKLEARVVVSDRLDIDNGLKSLLDALQHAKAYRNDGQIRRLIVDVVAMPAGREWCDVALREIAA
ncbi:MAG: RusA family crossover junction endodeoxyribonuclease [Burkholderiales bacterium]|nr:RusA family crossover junction endodeoxyribonuclease [Burkholderiales bacterium]